MNHKQMFKILEEFKELVGLAGYKIYLATDYFADDSKYAEVKIDRFEKELRIRLSEDFKTLDAKQKRNILIHELVHVRQFREGRQLFDRRYGYTDRPTEIEAYRYAVEEAKRIGMTDEEILRYLKTEWMSEENHRKLAETLNVKTSKQ